jgi:hypothetical protein
MLLNCQGKLGIHRVSRRHSDGDFLDSALFQYPWCMRAELACGKPSSSNPVQDRPRVNIEHRSRFIDRHIAATSPLTGGMHGNIVTVSERADTPSAPAIPVRSATTDSIDDGSDHGIGL